MGNESIAEFDVTQLEDIAVRWADWIERFEYLLIMKNTTITTDAQKIASLWFYGGSGLKKAYIKSEPSQTERDKDKDVQAIKVRLTNFFNAKVNYLVNRLNFRDLFQFENEPFEEFSKRLQEKAKICGFDKAENEQIFQVIHKCNSQMLRRKLLEEGIEKLTWQKVIEIGKREQAVATQVKNCARYVNNVTEMSKSSKFAANLPKPKSEEHNTNEKRITSKKCFRRGGEYPH